jgi:hypothetical protein
VAGNFALSISGLEQACARVNRIEPITASRTLMAEQVGAARVIHAEPTSFDVSNLSFTVAESSAEPFPRLARVVRGEGRQRPRPRAYRVDFAPQRRPQDQPVRGEPHGLGIVRAAPEASGPSDAVRPGRVDLYCEQLKLETTAQPPPKDPESPPIRAPAVASPNPRSSGRAARPSHGPSCPPTFCGQAP